MFWKLVCLIKITIAIWDEETIDAFDICEIAEEYDDKKEDGFAVLSSLEVALRSFKLRHPHTDEGILFTDGAKCYSGKYLALVLPLLATWDGVGIRMLHHHTGEPGKGKTELDAHFATGSKRVQESIATGQCDTVNASTFGLLR